MTDYSYNFEPAQRRSHHEPSSFTCGPTRCSGAKAHIADLLSKEIQLSNFDVVIDAGSGGGYYTH